MTDTFTVYFDGSYGVDQTHHEVLVEVGRVLERTGLEPDRVRPNALVFANETDAAAFRLACPIPTYTSAITTALANRIASRLAQISQPMSMLGQAYQPPNDPAENDAEAGL